MDGVALPQSRLLLQTRRLHNRNLLQAGLAAILEAEMISEGGVALLQSHLLLLTRRQHSRNLLEAGLEAEMISFQTCGNSGTSYDWGKR